MPHHKLNIETVNQTSLAEFQQIFGNVIEHCPDAAKWAHSKTPFANVAALVHEFVLYLDVIKTDEKIAILKSHPDLAGKLADENALTTESTAEQHSAGLLALTAEQKALLAQLNKRYLEKFDFPFVICVRTTNKFDKILEGLHERLPNPRYREIINGIDEVRKIAAFRLKNIVHD